MKRRDFFAGAASLAAGATVGLPAIGLAQSISPKAGTDYVKLERTSPVDAPAGKVEVLEFFWYNCPHCNVFEPQLAAWVKKLPDSVAFRRVPIAFQPSFEPQQRLFYALEAMGQLDKWHARVYAAIHGDKQNLSQAPAIIDWVARQGIDKALFTSHFNSFSTAAKASRATQVMKAYQIEGVPALGVAGRFYTDGSLAKSMERALQVTEFLVAEVRAGR